MVHLRLAMVVALALLGLGCGRADDGEDDRPPIGAASAQLTELDGVSVSPAPLVATELTTTIGRSCSGFDLPPISEQSCTYQHIITARQKDDNRALSITRYLPSGSSQNTPIVMKRDPDPKERIVVEIRQTNPQETWSSAYVPTSTATPTTERGIAIDVAPDGKVTVRLDHVVIGNNQKTGGFRLTGVVVLDCVPEGADTARCNSGAGPARP